METTNQIMLSKKFIADLQEDVRWAEDELGTAETRYRRVQGAVVAVDNLCTLLKEDGFIREAKIITYLLSNLTKIQEPTETEFANAADICNDFKSFLDEAHHEQSLAVEKTKKVA